MSGIHVAYAVVRDDPPIVLIADDLDVLHRLLALNVVARTEPSRLSESEVRALRTSLLEERWEDAVSTWIDLTGVAIDVYTERIATSVDAPEDIVGAQLQFSPLFRD